MNDLKNDIERYLKGELSPLEMHALEKKALSDPFLADALEGASEIKAEAFASDVHDLQMMIDKRTDQSKKIIPLWNWTLRIAAGLIVIAVSTFVILNIARDNKPVQLADNKIESEPPATEQKEQAPVLDSVEHVTSTLSLSESKPKTPQPVPLPTIPLEKPNANVPASAATSQNHNTITQANSPAVTSENENVKKSETQEVQIARAKSEVTSASSSKKVEIQGDVLNDSKREISEEQSFGSASDKAAVKSVANIKRTITGHVSSLEDGSALPGVNVLIKETDIGTVTDAEGNYEITLNDKQNELVFSFIGLQSTEMSASKIEELDVQMSNDVSQLSEVIVTGYAVRNDYNKDDESDNLELASPAGGRKAYKQYLEKSLRYPVVALENKIEGKVTIEFTVGTTGTLSEFKVLRGLGYGCDEEVIRLVKDGARWTPSKYGKELVESNVKIRLRFALPKK